jgi:hypothetical protein
MIREPLRALVGELAATLDDVADALLRRDRDLAERALLRARGIDDLSARFTEAVDVSRETTRFAPPRRRLRRRVEGYAGVAVQMDLAVRNVRVLARGAIRAARLDENIPPETAEAIRELAAAVRAAGDALDDAHTVERIRRHALNAAATATLVLETTGNLSVSVIVGQVRSTATDLVAATGLDTEDAVDAVRRAVDDALASAP